MVEYEILREEEEVKGKKVRGREEGWAGGGGE